MTRNEKSLQALFSGFYDPYRDPYEDDYMSPKFYDVITKDGKIVKEHLYYNSAYEIFKTNPGHYDIVEEITNSRRPIKSDVIIKFEYKDKKYGNPNAKYTQTAIYPSVNEFKKIMDKNNIEFKIIRVTPLK